jgi:hypothetical protein
VRLQGRTPRIAPAAAPVAVPAAATATAGPSPESTAAAGGADHRAQKVICPAILQQLLLLYEPALHWFSALAAAAATASDDEPELTSQWPAPPSMLLRPLPKDAVWQRLLQQAQAQQQQQSADISGRSQHSQAARQQVAAHVLQPEVPQQQEQPAAPRQPLCCSRCGATRAQAGLPRFKVCAGCDVARYCGSECQRQHWAQHRTMCQQVQQGAAGAACGRKAIRREARRAGVTAVVLGPASGQADA